MSPDAARRLACAGNRIGVEGARELAAALRANTTLTQLDLWGAPSRGSRGALPRAARLVRLLASASRGCSVGSCVSPDAARRLACADNGIGVDGARELAAALRANTTLKELSLSGAP